MKQNALAEVLMNRPEPYRFEPEDLEALTVLTEKGPVFRLGTVRLSEPIWELVPTRIIGFALDMHQCGHWGSVPEFDWQENTRTLREVRQGRVKKSRIASRWLFSRCPEFWVITNREGTFVLLPIDLEPVAYPDRRDEKQGG